MKKVLLAFAVIGFLASCDNSGDAAKTADSLAKVKEDSIKAAASNQVDSVKAGANAMEDSIKAGAKMATDSLKSGAKMATDSMKK